MVLSHWRLVVVCPTINLGRRSGPIPLPVPGLPYHPCREPEHISTIFKRRMERFLRMRDRIL